MTEAAPEIDTAREASKLIGKQLLEAMMAELQAATTPWHRMSESDQHLALERMKVKTRAMVATTMRALFAGTMAACTATLTGLRVGGSVTRGSIEVAKNAVNRHELMDRVGQSVVMLMLDPEQHVRDLDQVRVESQQRNLFDDVELPDNPHADDPETEADASPETQALEEASQPAPDDPTKWVQTANKPDIERHVETGEERRSLAALQVDLINKLCDINQDPKLDSIDFDQDEIEAAPRGQILLALLWADTYAKGVNEDTQAKPDFLRFAA